MSPCRRILEADQRPSSRAVFDLVLAPFQEVVQEDTVMDCADGKTNRCFAILSAWIADHEEQEALHGIGSK